MPRHQYQKVRSVACLNVFSHFTALSTPWGVYCVQTVDQITVMNEYWGPWWAVNERVKYGNHVNIWLGVNNWNLTLQHGSSITIQGGDGKVWVKKFSRLHGRSMRVWNFLNGHGPKPEQTRINPTTK